MSASPATLKTVLGQSGQPLRAQTLRRNRPTRRGQFLTSHFITKGENHASHPD